MSNMEILIVGAGFTGSCAARRLAENGHRVKVIDKRLHVGGNAYDELDSNGVLIHSYGPHMFFTDDDEVVKFVSKFCSWIEYEPYAYTVIDDKLLSMPFNNLAFKTLLGEERYSAFWLRVKEKYGEKRNVFILDMINSDDELIKGAAMLLYEKDYLPYNIKHWGLKPDEIDFSVTARIPVRLTEECRLKDSKYQLLPKHGYTSLFNNMLNHPNITLALNTEFNNDRQDKNTIVLYTGMLDRFFDYCYGELPYRAIKFSKDSTAKPHRLRDIAEYYPDLSLPYTRKTDYSFLPNNKGCEHGTVITEQPVQYNHTEELPFYVVLTETSKKLHKRYLNLAKKNKNLFVGGRLADFRYYNMDDAVKRGLQLADEIIEFTKSGERHD